jgi:hypothetical protein
MFLSLQLSRAEMLLLLGLLQLPLPLALGEYPADQDVAALGVALSAAASGLAARDLLTLSADPAAPPTPVPAVAALISDIALAEACLIQTTNVGGAPAVLHITRRGATYVAHSCPQPGVHRLERLADPAELIDQVVTALALPSDIADHTAGPAITLPAEPLAAALDALSAGDPAGARARLLTAGAPLAVATALIAPPATGPVRHALVALRGLAAETPESDGALVLSGPTMAWLGAATPHDAAQITLKPAAQAAVQARITALVAWIG